MINLLINYRGEAVAHGFPQAFIPCAVKKSSYCIFVGGCHSGFCMGQQSIQPVHIFSQLIFLSSVLFLYGVFSSNIDGGNMICSSFQAVCILESNWFCIAAFN